MEGSIRDPLFGISQVKRSEVFPETEGTEEGNESVTINANNEDFLKVLVSSNAKPIKDDGELYLSLLSLHDACYNLDSHSEYGIERADGSYIPSHDSLRPMTMKKPYNLFGDGSYLSMLTEEFTIFEVYSNTGITLPQWLQMTRVEHKVIKKAVDRKKKLQTAINEQTNEELNAMAKGVKK